MKYPDCMKKNITSRPIKYIETRKYRDEDEAFDDGFETGSAKKEKELFDFFQWLQEQDDDGVILNDKWGHPLDYKDKYLHWLNNNNEEGK